MILSIWTGFLISLCFAVIFRARGFNIIFTGLSGAAGAGVAFLVTQLSNNGVFAAFAASIVVTACAEILARKRKAPITSFLAPALIPVVRGAQLYEGIMRLFNGDRAIAGDLLYIALVDTAALALGIIVVSSFVQLITKRKNSVPKHKE